CPASFSPQEPFSRRQSATEYLRLDSPPSYSRPLHRLAQPVVGHLRYPRGFYQSRFAKPTKYCLLEAQEFVLSLFRDVPSFAYSTLLDLSNPLLGWDATHRKFCVPQQRLAQRWRSNYEGAYIAQHTVPESCTEGCYLGACISQPNR